MESGKKSSHRARGLQICCGVTALLLIIILVLLMILFLTILRPKQPQIIPLPVKLSKIEVVVFPAIKLNATLALAVTINNPNYGKFKYKDTTAYIDYHGEVVAEAPIGGDTIPARGRHNISTSVEIIGDKLIASPYYQIDSATGILNFTSLTILHGKVNVFNILKKNATTHTTCDISVTFQYSKTLHSVCKSKVHL